MGRTKMKKYKCMIGSKNLASHVPETRWMTKTNVFNLVTKYGQVILKPLGGSRGRGIIRVARLGDGHYQIHRENQKRILHGQDQMYSFLKRKTGGSTYLVQQRVPLATVQGRPFDIRVIVQRRSVSKEWNVTGIVTKVAGQGYIVTNITRSKGTLLSIGTALHRSSLSGHSRELLISRIKRLALLTAKRLGKIYPHQRIYGMDIGLDKNGHAWMIEANRKPLMSHFLKLKDKSMYRRIQAYKKG
ncbi:YheC/YheD family protein [Brevibacillus ginsengisoli]|uniref:YheC/YheD family protein n=1 Tax=Brevibacillus ginsengisoli TaxID=363854 RepID=UPI003CF2B49C